jgi:hypothetical protein
MQAGYDEIDEIFQELIDMGLAVEDPTGDLDVDATRRNVLSAMKTPHSINFDFKFDAPKELTENYLVALSRKIQQALGQAIGDIGSDGLAIAEEMHLDPESAKTKVHFGAEKEQLVNGDEVIFDLRAGSGSPVLGVTIAMSPRLPLSESMLTYLLQAFKERFESFFENIELTYDDVILNMDGVKLKQFLLVLDAEIENIENEKSSDDIDGFVAQNERTVEQEEIDFINNPNAGVDIELVRLMPSNRTLH